MATELLGNLDTGAPLTLDHPAIAERVNQHGTRLLDQLRGETVVKAIPGIGYLHRGVEKLSESLGYDQLAPIFERVVDSVRFDDELQYRPRFGDRWPPRPRRPGPR